MIIRLRLLPNPNSIKFFFVAILALLGPSSSQSVITPFRLVVVSDADLSRPLINFLANFRIFLSTQVAGGLLAYTSNGCRSA